MVDSVVEDKIDENLLAQFMKKIMVWDYNSSSKENYLALTQDQKEKIIRDYYSYLLERLPGSKGIHFFVWKMCLNVRIEKLGTIYYFFIRRQRGCYKLLFSLWKM